jgi:hypothetical protein
MTIGHRRQLMGAVKALNSDIKRWEAQIVEPRLLVGRLSHHADAEGRTDGMRGTAQTAHEKPAPKRRRRRRRSAPRHMPRHAQRRRKKPDVVEPAGATQFAADLFGELENVKVGIGASDPKAARVMLVRGDEIARAMAERAKASGVTRYALPPWCTKAIRMRMKRAATSAAKGEAPRKKKPRPPAVPIPPVIKQTGPWTEEPNGVRSRQVVST